jgi:hypothetical protein
MTRIDDLSRSFRATTKGPPSIRIACWLRSSMVPQLPRAASRLATGIIRAGRGANRAIGPDASPSRWSSFAGRLGLDRQRMHASIEFSPQEMVDRTMALDQALALKGVRDYFDVKVGTARARGRAGPLHGMSVPRVLGGFVDDFDGVGGKGGL